MRYKGVVQTGEKRGSALGFPTINIPLEDAGGKNASGIFAAKVFVGGREYAAAAYVNSSRGILEAHLLNFSDDLYGKEVEVELLEKIRDDEKFADEDALKAAIARDIAKVREYRKN
jgi:riboflavin kinase/FMN adenylyltransferase